MATFPTNPDASALIGDEVIPCTQGGVDKRTTPDAIAALATASTASYNNSTSGLSATNVQDAIDEIVDAGGGGSVDADDVSFDNTATGMSATNVQDAIDEGLGDIASALSSILGA